MYTLKDLLNELREALRDSDLATAAEVVGHATRAKPLASDIGTSRLLHCEPGLTVLHTAVNPGFGSPPHDHRTWAVIGVYCGQEDNTFYRLIGSTRRIEPIGERKLGSGEVLRLDPGAIHKISNPLQEKLIALHVHGKNIFVESRHWRGAAVSAEARHRRHRSLMIVPAFVILSRPPDACQGRAKHDGSFYL